jgi:hypothetical protein
MGILMADIFDTLDASSGDIFDKIEFDHKAEYERLKNVDMAKETGVPDWGRKNPNLYATYGAVFGNPTDTPVKTAVSRTVRPFAEMGGMAAGSIVSAPAAVASGPLAPAVMVAGEGSGYAIGKGAADLLDQAMGLKQPLPLGEQAIETGKDVLTGGAYSMGGQSIGSALIPIFKAGKWIFNKTLNPSERVLSEQGFKTQAGNIIRAETSEGPIYARNAEEAKKIQDEIPGLKFTLGQSTNDPKLIMMERAKLRANPDAASKNAEVIAANNEALRNYYQKSFSGKENIDDLVKSLTEKQTGLQKNVQTADKMSQTLIENMPVSEPSKTGQSLFEKLGNQASIVKEQAGKLYDKIPETTIPIDDMLKEFDNISKPMSRFEKPENIPSVLSRVTGEFTDETIPKTMSLKDLQGLRSELLEESSQIMSSATPNRRMASRLTRAAESIDNVILKAETGNEELKQANKFFKKNYAEVFRQGEIGNILRPGSNREVSKVPLAQIPGKLFNVKNPDVADQLIKAIGKEDSASLMRDHAAYDLFQSATNNEGKLVSSKFRSWLKKNYSLLKKFGIEGDFDKLKTAQIATDMAENSLYDFEKSVASKVLNADPEKAIANAIKGNNTGKAAFDLMNMVKNNKAATNGLKKAFAEHILDTVQTTAKDIANNPTISNAAFNRTMEKYMPAMRILYKEDPLKLQALRKMQRAYEIAIRNTKSPIGGGSDTAENMLAAISNLNILSRPATVAKGVFKYFKKYNKDKVNEFVERAIFDPEYADTLIKASKTKLNDKDIQMIIDQKVIQMDEFKKRKLGSSAAGFMTGLGSIQNDQSR